MVPPDLWAPFLPQTRPTRAPAGAIGGLTWGIMWRDGIRSTRWNQPQDPRAARRGDVLVCHWYVSPVQSLGDPIGVVTWCLLNDLRLVGIFLVASDVRRVSFPDLDGLRWVWLG